MSKILDKFKQFFFSDLSKEKDLISNDSFKEVDENEVFIDLISRKCNGFEGKRVLEVGTDQNGVLLKILVSKFNAKEVVGINLVIEDRSIQDNCKVLNGDIRSTIFEDNFFDVIISSSVFEHVHNFDQALKEMYRVLKPGGYLYSHFGPIWSTSYGHHLWMDFDSKSYNYWNFELPPYCHLLMSDEQLYQYCYEKTNNNELSKAIVSYVFESEDQNRLLYEDYETAVKNSKFDIVFFKGYDHSVLSSKYTSMNFIYYMNSLKNKYPNYTNFQYDGITMLLTKNILNSNESKIY